MFLLFICTFVYFCKISFNGSRILSLKDVCMCIILNIYVMVCFFSLSIGMAKLFFEGKKLVDY